MNQSKFAHDSYDEMKNILPDAACLYGEGSSKSSVKPRLAGRKPKAADIRRYGTKAKARAALRAGEDREINMPPAPPSSPEHFLDEKSSSTSQLLKSFVSTPVCEEKGALAVVNDETASLLQLIKDAKALNPGKKTDETGSLLNTWEIRVAAGNITREQLHEEAKKYSEDRSSYFRGGSWFGLTFKPFTGKPAVEKVISGTEITPVPSILAPK